MENFLRRVPDPTLTEIKFQSILFEPEYLEQNNKKTLKVFLNGFNFESDLLLRE